jgi:acyl-CoA thioesterase FadM
LCCLHTFMQVVCLGQATVVFLDATYKPVRVPAQVKAALAHLHQEYKEGVAGS